MTRGWDDWQVGDPLPDDGEAERDRRRHALAADVFRELRALERARSGTVVAPRDPQRAALKGKLRLIRGGRD